MLAAILFVSTVIITIVCTALVLHPEYEDGLIGRIALSALALMAATRIPDSLDALMTQDVRLPLHALVAWASIALFFARHWWRFYHARKGRYLRAMRDARLHVGGHHPILK